MKSLYSLFFLTTSLKSSLYFTLPAHLTSDWPHGKCSAATCSLTAGECRLGVNGRGFDAELPGLKSWFSHRLHVVGCVFTLL